jgi:thiamine-monophosphate kinase
MSTTRQELAELGEFGLINRISQQFHLRNKSSIKGIGDDAAVIDAGTHYQLLSTDLLLEGIHFDLAYVPLQHLGYKAIACNVSDIAAMNGTPQQVVVGLGLSNRMSLEAVDALYSGIRAACDNYNVDLVGGDTSASASGLLISVAVMGTVAKDKVVYRNGARPNDILCVTGDLGAAYTGLLVLQREKEVFLTNPDAQPELEKFEYVVSRQLKPEARMDIIHELADLQVMPTAMIDVSDGLASELFHIATQSNCGIKLFEDKVPIDTETFNVASLDFKIDPITCALNGGEDYELLFTIRQDDLEKIKNHPDIHLIGHLHDHANQHVMVTKGGNAVALQAQGWNHFKK